MDLSHSSQRPPSPAKIRDESHDINRTRQESNNDEREATELGQLSRTGSRSPLDLPSVLPTEPDSGTTARHTNKHHLFDGVRRSWRHYVQLHVPHADCRDHLANERTFLAYQRTSLALSIIGIVVTQLFGLQFSPNASPVFGYHVLGKPLGALFQAAAIVVMLVGGHRFYRQQISMARGYVRAGGWEIWIMMGFMFILMTLVFGLLIAVDVSK